MLNFRDGPKTCLEYSRSLARDPSVTLCASSAPSVVKNITTDLQKSTGQHRVNNKDNPQALHGTDPNAGGRFLCKKLIAETESPWPSVKTSVSSVFKIITTENHREGTK